ncbi:MAG: phosphoribosylglycinamide formyltransferase [Alphaproteobacteria bacterium]
MSAGIAVFISGRGSNLLSILESCKDPSYPAHVALVLSNRPDATGLDIAKQYGVPTEVVEHAAYKNRDDFDEDINQRLMEYKIDLIALAGFMRVLGPAFVEQWSGRILNIHPSLLPKYKGLNPQKRALENGETQSGCSVHFVVPDVDSGAVIAQRCVPILAGDTPETLSERILEEEHILYPQAIRRVVQSLSGS